MEILDCWQAAAALNVSRDTLAMWRWKNRGPAYIRLGRKIAYRREAIECWLAAATVETNESASREAAE